MGKISVKDLNLYYGDFQALKNCNLEIEKNKITAFIGPSGCGKSTLLKSINRMNDLVEGCRIDGKILLDGQDVYKDVDVNLLRKRVGMVFQKPNPFPMSIYDNIAFGPRTHGIRSKSKLDDIVEKSLRDAAIWEETKDRLKKSALGMSGGQQQRLCIARALAVQPEVLLMDEPTSALDPISTSKIEDLAMELKKDYTIVMVTHNMQQAVRVSDNTAFFLLGLDAGADDYVTKPFGLMELVSRIKAVLRRTKKTSEEEFVAGALSLDLSKHEVKVEGKEVLLTYKEFELLSKLVQNRNIVLKRERLLEDIWGYDSEIETRTVDVHVRTLRQKLGVAGDMIQTVRGVGYRFGGANES